MKKIPLIKTAISNTQAPKDFLLDYRLEFLRAVELAPEGIIAAQMRIPINIAFALREAETDLLLEEPEWNYLCSKLLTSRFPLIAPEIVAMVQAVQEAQDVA